MSRHLEERGRPARFLLCLSLISAIPLIASALIDRDADGMSDLWEQSHGFSTEDNGTTIPVEHPDADPDGDGWSNLRESIAGSDPYSSLPPEGFLQPTVVKHPTLSSVFVVSWPTVEGKSYKLFVSPDMSPGSWTQLDEAMPGDGNPIEIAIEAEDEEENVPDRLFWRVSVSDVDADADGLSDAEEAALGTNRLSADSDGDGLGDSPEVHGGTDPLTEDTDGDGAFDGKDADSHDNVVNWRPSATPTYALIPLEEVDYTGFPGSLEPAGGVQGWPVSFHDLHASIGHDGMILWNDVVPAGGGAWRARCRVWRAGQWSADLRQPPVSFQSLDFATTYLSNELTDTFSPTTVTASPWEADGPDFAHALPQAVAGNVVIGTGRHVGSRHDLPWTDLIGHTPEGVPITESRTDGTATVASGPEAIRWALSGEGGWEAVPLAAATALRPVPPQLDPSADYEQSHFGHALGSPGGAVALLGGEHNDTDRKWKIWTPGASGYVPGGGPPAWEMPYVPEEGTYFDITAIEDGGSVAGRRVEGFFGLPALQAIESGVASDLGVYGWGEAVHALTRINLGGDPATTALVAAGTGLWVKKDGSWQAAQRQPDIGPILAITADGTLLGPESLWRNGIEIPLDTLVAHLRVDGPESEPRYTNLRGYAMNTAGAIVALADDALQESPGTKSLVMLVPMTVVAPNGPIHELKASDPAPRVQLAGVSEQAVQVLGDTAKIRFTVEVDDPLSRLIPASSDPGLSGVKCLVNGSEVEDAIALERESATEEFWKPYSGTYSTDEIEVEVPAWGTSRIRIETGENAAGQAGGAEFDIVFREIIPAATVVPSSQTELILNLPASLDEEAKETLEVVSGNQTFELEETEDDSRIFEADGVAWRVYLSSGYSTDPVSVDRPKVLVTGLSGPIGSASGGTISCVETALDSKVFLYQETWPESVTRGPSTWELAGVSQVVPDAGDGEWFPIAVSVALPEQTTVEIEGESFDSGIPGLPRSAGTASEKMLQTAEGKPLIACVLRNQDFSGETGVETFDLVYYDADAGELVKLPLAASATGLELNLRRDQALIATGELPVKRIHMREEDGSPSPGVLPVGIEQLRRMLEGRPVPEITSANCARIELTGYASGEVLRFGGGEEGSDFFDIVAGDEEAFLIPNARHIRLEQTGDRIFRSREKVLFYIDSALEGEDRLSLHDWQQLKALGYVAIHNPPNKVFVSEEDLEWIKKERGNFHPLPADAILGASDKGLDKSDAQYWRYKGYEDHHLFNAYHKNPERAKCWKVLFDGELDVDSFTVPLRKEVHDKIQHIPDKAWNEFLNEIFEDGTSNLKPEFLNNKDLILRKRGEAMVLMRELAHVTGMDLDLVRPYPGLLDKGGFRNNPLFKVLTESEKAVGSSALHLKHFDGKYTAFLGEEAAQAGREVYQRVMKRHLLRWGLKSVSTLLVLGTAEAHANNLRLASDVASFGMEEGGARWMNQTFEVEDLPLCKAIMKRALESIRDDLDGAELVPTAPMRNGRHIVVGWPTFKCDFDLSRKKVARVTPLVIAWIKKMPDGSYKVATRNPKTNEEYVEIWDYFIDDYYPTIGDSRQAYDQAFIRAYY